MKKILILLFLLNLSVFVYANNNDIASKIKIIEQETNTYPGENISLEERLKNIEIYIFGEAKKGDMNQRITTAAKALSLSVTPNQQNNSPKYEIENDVTANYPAVDNLEQKNFGKTFKAENIYNRLDRLEKKIFGTKSYNKSLNERVADLQEKSVPEFSAAAPITNENQTTGKDYNYYSPQSADPIISKIENKLWKHTFENESVSSRLSRIEEKMFGQNFDTDSNSVRTERIKSVLKAQKSGGEYKANKFAKYATTGLQIGGLVLLILAMIL